jgi:desulfoferrodoxin (superoxide reductase-like protein)
MKRASGLILILFVLSIFSATTVLADVPNIRNLKTTKDGTDTILEIEVRHGGPTNSHYIDIIEVEVNERLDRIDDLDPQTTTIFTYRHNIGNTQYDSIRVRVRCNLHGWSSWANIDAVPEPPFYETPVGIATIGGSIVLVILILFILRKQGKI